MLRHILVISMISFLVVWLKKYHKYFLDFLNLSQWQAIGQRGSIYTTRKSAQINHLVFQHYFLWCNYWLFDSRNIINTWFLNASHWPAIGQRGFNLHGRKNRSDQSRPKCKAVKIRIITFMYYIHSIFIMGITTVVFWTYDALQRWISCCYGVCVIDEQQNWTEDLTFCE